MSVRSEYSSVLVTNSKQHIQYQSVCWKRTILVKNRRTTSFSIWWSCVRACVRGGGGGHTASHQQFPNSGEQRVLIHHIYELVLKKPAHKSASIDSRHLHKREWTFTTCVCHTTSSGGGKANAAQRGEQTHQGLQWHQRHLFLKPNGNRARQKSGPMELDCQENHWIHTLFGVHA